MFKRILLPFDGTPLAEQALPVAVAQAEQFQAELVLLKVLEPVTEVYGMLGSPIRKAEKLTVPMVTGYLESVAARIRKRHTGQTLTPIMRPDNPAVLFQEITDKEHLCLAIS